MHVHGMCVARQQKVLFSLHTSQLRVVFVHSCRLVCLCVMSCVLVCDGLCVMACVLVYDGLCACVLVCDGKCCLFMLICDSSIKQGVPHAHALHL